MKILDTLKDFFAKGPQELKAPKTPKPQKDDKHLQHHHHNHGSSTT